MKRRLLLFLFCLCVLLTLMTVALWICGAFRTDLLIATRGPASHRDLVALRLDGQQVWFAVVRTRVFNAYGVAADVPPSAWSFRHEQGKPMGHAFVRPDAELWWQRWGFDLDVSGAKAAGYRASAHTTQVALPWWFLFIACVALAVGAGRPLWGAPARRRARIALGLCGACGYDLRGAAHERCPECGAIVESHAVGV